MGKFLDSVEFYSKNLENSAREKDIDDIVERHKDSYSIEYLEDLYNEVNFPDDWILKSDLEKRCILDEELREIRDMCLSEDTDTNIGTFIVMREGDEDIDCSLSSSSSEMDDEDRLIGG